jgi:hypothetical protein
MKIIVIADTWVEDFIDEDTNEVVSIVRFGNERAHRPFPYTSPTKFVKEFNVSNNKSTIAVIVDVDDGIVKRKLLAKHKQLSKQILKPQSKTK